MRNTALLATCHSLLAVCFVRADTTIDATDKYAYGANIGWINLEGNGTDGVVVGEYFLSGFAYGANVGWIDFGDGSPTNSTAYSNDSGEDFGVNQDGAGNLSGLAYGANIGWINFGWAGREDENRPRVDLSSGAFKGFAYGANIGWINLGAGFLATDTVFCADRDGDGISDVWETLHFRNLATAGGTSDQDRDGISDKDEYFGGSDPNDGASFMRVVSISQVQNSPTTRRAALEFMTTPARRYRIMISSDLQSFSDSGLGEFAPSAGTTTTKVVAGRIAEHYFRVVAVKPLQAPNGEERE